MDAVVEESEVKTDIGLRCRLPFQISVGILLRQYHRVLFTAEDISPRLCTKC